MDNPAYEPSISLREESGEQEKLALQRAYEARLVGMADAYRELPRALSKDFLLQGLADSEAGIERISERVAEVYRDVMESSNENLISAFQQRLARRDAEAHERALQIAEAQDEVDRLRREIARLSSEAIEASTRYEKLEARLEEEKKRAPPLEAQLREWQERFVSTGAEIASLRAENATQSQELKKALEQLPEIGITKAALADVQAKLEAERTANAGVARRVETAEAETAAVRQTLRTFLGSLLDVVEVRAETQHAALSTCGLDELLAV
eukprot:6828991-Prymnesium_polylepis.1